MSRPDRKPRVLISAYACEPNKGSEPGVGWNWAKQIAKFSEVWVMTRANNREVIEEELNRYPSPDLHFVYYDIPKYISFWKKKMRGFYAYYFLWQLGAFSVARKLHRLIGFDVVHQLTFGNLWLPNLMPCLDIPLIWGPIGGGEQIPGSFRKQYDLKARVRERLRDTVLNVLKIDIFFLYAVKRSSVIIAKTKETANRIRGSNRKKVVVMTDVAVSPRDIQLLNNASNSLTITAVGNLVAWRGFDLLIKAFLRVRDKRNIKLLIVGEGNYRRKLEEMVKKLNLSDYVIFTGKVRQTEYLEYLAGSTIYVNSSLKEGGVTALFDALSLGLPVICFDVAGSPEIVTGECGFKLKLINPEQTITDLTYALSRLAHDTALRIKMGKEGRRRVLEDCTWEKKGKIIRKIYEGILGIG